MSTANIITFLPNPIPLDQEKLPRASNPIPYSEHLHWSKSGVFSVNLTAPEKEFSNGKPVLCLYDH